MKTLVVATQNQGKIKEIKMLLKDMPIEVKAMGEMGIDVDVEETGTTFEENAILKAEGIKAYTDALVLADDSGLEIDYFDKAPGVYSARYLGKETPYEEKNAIILDKMKEVKKEKRTARFVCAMALAGKEIQTITTRATIEGYIGYKIEGENGFGYDPIFVVEEYGTTTASLPPEVKNKISHRGKALQQIKIQIQKLIEG